MADVSSLQAFWKSFVYVWLLFFEEIPSTYVNVFEQWPFSTTESALQRHNTETDCILDYFINIAFKK